MDYDSPIPELNLIGVLRYSFPFIGAGPSNPVFVQQLHENLSDVPLTHPDRNSYVFVVLGRSLFKKVLMNMVLHILKAEFVHLFDCVSEFLSRLSVHRD